MKNPGHASRVFFSFFGLDGFVPRNDGRPVSSLVGRNGL